VEEITLKETKHTGHGEDDSAGYKSYKKAG
jgi:hypothetical protein